MNYEIMATYKTSDMALAATLESLRFYCTGLEKGPNGRMLFCFDDADELHQVLEMYWTSSLRLEPMSLLMAAKKIKLLLRNSAISKGTSSVTPSFSNQGTVHKAH